MAVSDANLLKRIGPGADGSSCHEGASRPGVPASVNVRASARPRGEGGALLAVGVRYGFGGGEVGAGAVPTRGMAPPAGGVTGDIDADFHHQPGLRQRDVQLLPAAPSGGERPARPRMPAPSRLEQAGDRRACRSGEGGRAADALEAAFGVGQHRACSRSEALPLGWGGL